MESFVSIVVRRSTGEMIVSSPKYNVQETPLSLYETRMTVTIRKFQKEDIGSYRCIAKNSLGEVDSSIRLYGSYTLTISLIHLPVLYIYMRKCDNFHSFHCLSLSCSFFTTAHYHMIRHFAYRNT